MAEIKGLDDSDDVESMDPADSSIHCNSNGIYGEDEEIQNFGQYLLQTGSGSDIVLIVHCKASPSTTEIQQKPSHPNPLELDENDEHKSEPILQRKLPRRSAADKDIARCSATWSDHSDSNSNDSFAVNTLSVFSGDDDANDLQIVKSEDAEPGMTGSDPLRSDQMRITKRYRLHRGALTFCEYFKSQLSGRWNGDRLREITWSGDEPLCAVEQCLKLLYSECRCRGSNGVGPKVDRLIFGSVSDAMSILSVLCSWHFVYGIDRVVDYLSQRVTSYNVEAIHATASRLNRVELLALCQSEDPCCNLLSIGKMKEVLVMAVKLNRVWAKQIAEKEFDENLIRDRADINSSFLKDILNAMLKNIKLFLPLKGSKWIEGQIARWIPHHDVFEIWCIHSNVIEAFKKEHNVSITNPREFHFVSNTITAMLNAFITNFFIHKNISHIPWGQVLLFLNGWNRHITAKSISYILNVTPPMFQSKLCECCIDWIEHKSSSNLIDAQEARADIQTVLGAIMKCQQRAKFWEKTRHRKVYEKSPVLKSFSPQNAYGHRFSDGNEDRVDRETWHSPVVPQLQPRNVNDANEENNVNHGQNESTNGQRQPPHFKLTN